MNSNALWVIGNFVMLETRPVNTSYVHSKTLIWVGDVADSKSTSGGMLCIFVDNSCVTISLACQKQTAVSVTEQQRS